MKKFTLSILAVLLAAFVMTSCIDNAVSPEVKAIRAAQVNLINANTALTNAQAAKETALAALNNAMAAVQNANAAATSADTEAQLIANMVAVSNAEVTVAANEVAVQAQIHLLAELIAEYGATQAAIYLGKYQTANAKVQALATAIAAKAEVIAGLQLYFRTANLAYYTTVEEWYERDLDDKELILAHAVAALAIVEAVEADPAIAEAQKATLTAQIQDLDNKILAQAIVIAPLNTASIDAAAALLPKTTAKTAADAKVTAINLIKAEYALQQADVASAQADVVDALADAVSSSAAIQAELNPFLNALVAAYADNAGFLTQIADTEHAVRVATNQWRVAIAQGNALVTAGGDIEDAPTYSAALSAVEAVIGDIETLTENDLGGYDVEDETTYPNFDGEDLAEWTVTHDGVAVATAVGTTYSDGTNTFRVSVATAIAGTVTQLTAAAGSSVPVGAVTLTKVGTGAGDATLTTVAANTTINGTYEVDDENGVIEDYEIDNLEDGLIDEIDQNNADPDSEYAQAGVLYAPIEDFFDDGVAYDLVGDMGRYDNDNFLINFTKVANGVLADLSDDEDVDYDSDDDGSLDSNADFDGNGDNGWDEYWAAEVAVNTQNGLLTNLVDGDNTDAIEITETNAAARITALEAAMDLLVGTSTDDVLGGHTVALAAEAAALTAQTAAVAAWTPLKATADAAAAALAAAQKVSDAVTGFAKQRADAVAIRNAVNLLLAGDNAEVTNFRDAVELAQAGVDAAEKALADLSAELDEVDATIAHEQARLAELQLELAAARAEAAAWLALLNAALAG